MVIDNTTTFATFASIQSIFYAEFDPIQGPKVVYEVPSGFVTSSTSQDVCIDFDSLSEYIIPKPELCNRLVTISGDSYKLMGYPQYIVSSKYPRNALLFNLVFVFDSHSDVGPHEPIVRKCARTLRDLELECEFIHNKDTKPQIHSLIERLMDELNTYFECRIPIDDANTINLKLFPRYKPPPDVRYWDVPVLIIELAHVVDNYWDLTIRKILPFITGLYSVKQIAMLADVDLNLTRLAIQHLLYYGVCQLVDIFQFNNIYCPTPELPNLLTPELLRNCQSFITSPPHPPPTPSTILTLYTGLNRTTPLSQFMQDHITTILQMDIRRFIIWGVVHGIIRRVHKFPILLDKEKEALIPRQIRKYVDGRCSYDQICTMLNVGCAELDELLSKSCSLIYK